MQGATTVTVGADGNRYICGLAKIGQEDNLEFLIDIAIQKGFRQLCMLSVISISPVHESKHQRCDAIPAQANGPNRRPVQRPG